MVFIRYIFIAILFFGFSLISKAQNTQIDFGKNRVQYHPHGWFYVESPNFITYFGTGGNDLGKFTVLASERALDDIKQKLDFSYSKKIEVLVFGDINDFTQSNINYSPGVNEYNMGGGGKVIGNKIFVYFNGDHQHLNNQIRKGIAKIMMDYMLYGSNFSEIVQNAVLLSLPNWYADGLVSYLAQPWSVDKDDRLRDLFNNNLIKNFNKFASFDQTLAGESFWNYVDEKYDKGTIANLLYITRINRSMETGFEFVLGKTLDDTYKDWFQYYKERYEAEAITRKNPSSKYLINVKHKKNSINSVAKYSVDGNHFAFTESNLGVVKLILWNDETQQRKVILKYGLRNNILPIDEQNPVYTFDASGKKLVAFYVHHDKTYFVEYDLETKKLVKRLFGGLRKVYEINTGVDKNTLLLSATKGPNSDIYLYNYVTGNTTNITNDFWDDKNPHYVQINNRKGIVFASNRLHDTIRNQNLDTILPLNNYDAFFYNLKTKKTIRIIRSINYNESFTQQYNKSFLVFSSDQNGIANRYFAKLDSVFVRYDTIVYFKDSTLTNPRNITSSWLLNIPNNFIDSISYQTIYKDTFKVYTGTNYNTSITSIDIPNKSKYMVESFRQGNKMSYFKIPIRDSLKAEPVLTNTQFRTKSLFTENAVNDALNKNKERTKINPDELIYDTVEAARSNPFHSIFQNEFVMPWDTQTFIYADTETVFMKEPLWKNSKIIPYKLHTYTTKMQTQLDKGSIFKIYQPYLGVPQYTDPPLSVWMKMEIKDVMEDYRIQGGISVPSSLGSPAFFLRYQNFKYRLDKQFTYYRTTEKIVTSQYNPTKVKGNMSIQAITDITEAQFNYPINQFRSFRFNQSLRRDTRNFLSNKLEALAAKNQRDYWSISKLEYVHDNTRNVAMNIDNGLKFKFYVEHYQLMFPQQTNMNVAGVDARHYKKIFRNFIWANRFAMGSSFGKQKLLYYLGGVDSWLIAKEKFDNTNPVNNSQPYQYQTLVTNLRGFKQNTRNGNSFFVVNSEMRMPLYSIFTNKIHRSQFINNFQIIGFYDIGSAWVGPSPLSTKAKVSFTDVITVPNITIETEYYRNPIVMGYGWGLRSYLMGYFVRLDFAHGIDNGNITTKQTYLSITTDF
ncbi:MAG: hypothetical protein RIQ33_2416 [Bacteroidota bacterium]